MTDTILHQPVLLQKTINALKITPGEAYLDCTLGSAGHAVEIIKKGGKLFGLDVDPAAIKRAKARLEKIPNAYFRLKTLNFSQLKLAAQSWKLTSVAGILLDLGLSSEQLADTARGFSFMTAAPLDMRADPNLTVTAADLINGLTKKELNDLFKKLGQEQYSLAIANGIVRTRREKRISSTLELAQLVARVKPRRGKLHPATKVFQALRIAVNDERNNLKAVLPQAVDLLKPGGRLAVISFHSLEDRIIKHFIKNNQNLTNLTKKPIQPTQSEIANNPRARSAKLRIAQKI
jgi:16S rRNA (cytosine1402-N4)-methyltransferase